jgi:shikimate dehydrogenase
MHNVPVTLGLIGKNLSHSFSKNYFDKKIKDQNLSNYTYNKYDLATIDEVEGVLNNPTLKGLNVTMPYKQSILPYLDELSVPAQKIGAVNCVQIINGKRIGHNTDYIGFGNSIKPFVDSNHQRALVLGTGGASKAVVYVLQNLGIDYYYATSAPTKKTHNTLFYNEINNVVMNNFKFIINTTPVGMYPSIDAMPSIPTQYITPQHLIMDLIYNPEATMLLQHAKQQGAIVLNGLSMLHHQAEEAWKIWHV